MYQTKYFVFPAGKPEERFPVLPHMAGETTFSFAHESASQTGDLKDWFYAEPLYTWDNKDKDGAFVNNDVEQLDVTGVYDIVLESVFVPNKSEESEA